MRYLSIAVSVFLSTLSASDQTDRGTITGTSVLRAFEPIGSQSFETGWVNDLYERLVTGDFSRQVFISVYRSAGRPPAR